MVLGDPNYICNITCNGIITECSKEEKLLGITIELIGLNFTPHLGNLIKKGNQKLHVLSRVKCYMGFEQNKFLMSSFIKSQFSYCPLIWLFCSRNFVNKLNNIHEKCLQFITNDYDANFNEPLESSHDHSIHKICINYLMIEV